MVLSIPRQAGLPWGLNMNREPLGLEFVGQATGRAHQAFAQRAGTDAYQQAFTGRPRAGDRAGLHISPHLLIHPRGRAPQGELSQGSQVAQPEESLPGLCRLGGHVDLTLLEALKQLRRGQVHYLDLARLIQDTIRHLLADGNARDLCHHVVQAFKVLNVDSRVNVDSCREQFFNIEETFEVT